MSAIAKNAFHSVDEEWLASYAAGGLSPLKRLLISCQAEVQPRLASRLDQIDAVGAAFLESAHGEAVSDDFMAKLTASLEDTDATPAVADRNDSAEARSDKEDWMPSSLQDFLKHSDLRLKWKNAGPGVERAPLFEQDEERLYLLRAKPGLKLPMHTHRGEEWTLILQGGYHIGDQGYVRGDLHSENEDCTHQPIIDDHGEACISLVVDEGRLKFTDPIMKFLQPLIGI